MVKRRRAEVKVSTLSTEQRLNTFVKYFCCRGGVASRDLTVCSDENALGCDVQG